MDIRLCVFYSSVVLALAACGGGGDSSAPVTVSEPATASGAVPSVTPPAVANPCAIKYDKAAELVVTGPDPLSANLWHLKNTGQFNGTAGEDLNIEAAWALSRGSNVTIALIDDAFETIHPDLGNNFISAKGLDYRARASKVEPPLVGSGLPCNANDNHGTSVAGIIGAGYQNGTGGAGLAPNAKMVGYSAIETRFDDAIVDALNRDLQSNDIFNNSWGAPDDGELETTQEGFAQAIANGVTLGRGGRGAIYIFPSGNGGCALFDTQGRCQSELSGYDGYLNELGPIVVSALDHFGKHPSYSEPGANVLVSAPGGTAALGITSTSLGNKYTNSFYGTSAAVPMVSGVVALMLSANPSLTWRDVRLILARTARLNDQANSQWQPAGVQGGYRFNPLYGFGAVDAFAAVKAAQQWQSVGGSAGLRRCELTIGQESIIPDTGELLAKDFTFAADCSVSAIEHIEVMVDIDHEYSGDLDLRLVSPSNTSSQLTQARLCGARDRTTDQCGAFDEWHMASVRHLDEPAQGLWRLELRDLKPGKVGVIKTARLVVYGR
jgi:proprotein convertase subtilisin/kexin type 2